MSEALQVTVTHLTDGGGGANSAKGTVRRVGRFRLPIQEGMPQGLILWFPKELERDGARLLERAEQTWSCLAESQRRGVPAPAGEAQHVR